MKFKIGDKVMLKAVPYDDWHPSKKWAKEYYEKYKNKVRKIESISGNVSANFVSDDYGVNFKYLTRAPKVQK